MVIPAWVITGFLDSGKTTIINRLLKEELTEQDILVIQFEHGEIPLIEVDGIRVINYGKHQLETAPYELAELIYDELMENPVDLVLIEWNGMEHFHTLEKMFLQFKLKSAICIEKVIYTADEKTMQDQIADTYPISLSQIAASDYAYIQVEKSKKIQDKAEILFGINSDISVFTKEKWNRFVKKMFGYDIRSQMKFLLVSSAAILYLIVNPSFGSFASVFLGVFLQAIPFLAVGVLLSSFIQIYIPPDWIQKKFPKKVVSGQIFAVLAGFCLPVCDCASIPVFKSLVKKGVPLSAAITFMLVSPVINPVVILSTWYAFNGNIKIIAARCGLGILCAVFSGLSYLIVPPVEILRKDPGFGYRRGPMDYQFLNQGETERSKFTLTMYHAQNEFFTVGKYLLTGIFVSTVFQEIQPMLVQKGMGISLIASILFLMALAFVLSLCSSSDAVVVRTIAGSFPAGAFMGFLIFGPMMDIKNGAMLLDGFKKRFVVRLFFTTAILCFLAVFGFALLGSGGIAI